MVLIIITVKVVLIVMILIFKYKPFFLKLDFFVKASLQKIRF